MAVLAALGLADSLSLPHLLSLRYEELFYLVLPGFNSHLVILYRNI